MDNEKRVEIGDRFQWSIPLLQQILTEQIEGTHTLVLRVVDIRVEADGLKTIVMERTD
jgi:hypothetical protein